MLRWVASIYVSAALASAQDVGISVKITRSQSAGAIDVVGTYSPTIYYQAAAGYFTDGAIRIGDVPITGAANNWLSVSHSDFASGLDGWSMCCVFCVDGENASTANQTIASKGAASKYEWQLTWNRSTKLVTLTCYAADGGTSISATSTVVCNIGTTHFVAWQFAENGSGTGTGKARISVDNETPVESSGSLTIGSNDGAFRIGSWFAATQNFNGRLDSFGVSIGTDWCWANRATLYNGARYRRYEDLAEATLTAWWDFGNAETNAAGDPPDDPGFDRGLLNKWDWLLDATGDGNHALVQSGGVGTGAKAYIVRGLVCPIRTDATVKRVLGVPDQSGNGHDAIVPWYGTRISYSPTAWNGTPAFVFPGAISTGTNDWNGGFLTNFSAAPLMTGSNKSWSMACEFECLDPWNPSAQAMTGDEWLGITLGGYGTCGYVPWSQWSAYDQYPLDGGACIRWLTSTKYNPVEAGHRHRWQSKRYDDAAKINGVFSPFRGCLDAEKHVAVYSFDGATQTSKLWIDGILLLNEAQTSANLSGSGALGNQTVRVIQVGEGLLYPDQMIVPPSHPGYGFGSGGWAFYGHMKSWAFWAGTALDAAAAAAITEYLKPDYAATGSTPAFSLPPVAANLVQWWETRSGYGVYKSRTHNVVAPSERCTSDSDPIGTWRSRYGLGPSGVTTPQHLNAASDGGRPAFRQAVQNGHAVLRTTAASSQYLTTTTLAISQPYTVYMAVKMTRVGASYNYLWASGSTAEYISINDTSQGFYAGSSQTWTQTKTQQETFRVVALVFNGASSKAYIDGVEVKSGNVGSAGLTTLFLSTLSGSSYFASLDVGELIIYSAAHTTEVATMSTWLRHHWGID